MNSLEKLVRLPRVSSNRESTYFRNVIGQICIKFKMICIASKESTHLKVVVVTVILSVIE